MREAHERQLLTEPLKRCGLCNWSQKYQYAKEQWQQQVEGLEAEVRQLKRTLTRTLNRRLKPRSDAYSLQHNR